VAFLSNRGGREGVYEVGIDGSGLVQVAQSVRVANEGTQLAWQPHGGRLAVATGGGVWIVQPGGTTVWVHANYLDGWTSVGSVNQVAGWAPDGRMLAVTANVRGSGASKDLVLSPTGHKLWTVPHVGSWGATWSPQGLLAVTTGDQGVGGKPAIAIYDRTGRLRFKVRFGPLGKTAERRGRPGLRTEAGSRSSRGTPSRCGRRPDVCSFARHHAD
jgi:hypothetical protein